MHVRIHQHLIPSTQFRHRCSVHSFYTRFTLYLLPLSLCGSRPPGPDQFLTSKLDGNLSLPSPVSSRSIYRLADPLRLDENQDKLPKVCLRAFSDSLTVHGAAAQLFSDVSVAYEPIRKIALEYAVENRAAVSAKRSWKDTMEKIKRDEVNGSAPIFVALMDAQNEQAEKALLAVAEALKAPDGKKKARYGLIDADASNELSTMELMLHSLCRLAR
ncbi:hypothetical protein JCM11641_007282 [Rhodosporidiobolus odoratus]